MFRYFVGPAIILLAVVGSGFAQPPGAAPKTLPPIKSKAAGDVVISASGDLLLPWKQVQVCIGKTKTCKTALINLETREAARIDGKWASQFAPTGNGKEVKRLESARSQAAKPKSAGASSPNH